MNKFEADDDPALHRLEGTDTSQKGGLVIRKKGPASDVPKHEFKAPLPRSSLLGLDVLAANKRKQEKDVDGDRKDKRSKVSSYRDEDDNEDVEDRERSHSRREHKDRHYRPARIETPSHPGGVSDEVRAKLNKHRDRDRDRGVYATSSKKDKDKSDKRGDKYQERDRDRDRGRDRKDRSERRDRSERSERGDRSYRDWDETPSRRRDEPATPRYKTKDTPSRTSWDDDDDITPPKKSAWDLPTPTPSELRGDRSERRDRSHRSSRDKERRSHRKVDDTPMPTPSYKYNDWMKNKKSIKYTPRPDKENDEQGYDDDTREGWEEDQKRLDREWYSMDEGYDDRNNPFSGMSEEYTKKKRGRNSKTKE